MTGVFNAALAGLLLAVTICGCLRDSKAERASRLAGREREQAVKGILERRKKADLFVMFGTRIYELAEGQEEYRNIGPVSGKPLGTIAKRYKPGKPFEDRMSTVLPPGTEIYQVQGSRQYDILLAGTNGKTLVYRYVRTLEYQAAVSAPAREDAFRS